MRNLHPSVLTVLFDPYSITILGTKTRIAGFSHERLKLEECPLEFSFMFQTQTRSPRRVLPSEFGSWPTKVPVLALWAWNGLGMWLQADGDAGDSGHCSKGIISGRVEADLNSEGKTRLGLRVWLQVLKLSPVAIFIFSSPVLVADLDCSQG